MNIGFIGGGTMAEAILGGMLDGGVATAGDVMIGEPVPARRDYLAERYGVGVSDVNSSGGERLRVVGDGGEAAGPAQGVYGHRRRVLGDSQSVMSIVAGAKMKSLADGMRHDGIITGDAQHAGADWRGDDDVDVRVLGERGAS